MYAGGASAALALPPESERNLTEVSRPESNELDHFFEPALQGMVHGGTRVRRDARARITRDPSVRFAPPTRVGR